MNKKLSVDSPAIALTIFQDKIKKRNIVILIRKLLTNHRKDSLIT